MHIHECLSLVQLDIVFFFTSSGFVFSVQSIELKIGCDPEKTSTGQFLVHELGKVPTFDFWKVRFKREIFL